MTASTTQSVSPDAACPVPAPAADIDVSCRAPVLLLFVSAVLWLVVGSVLALIAAIKLHKGDFLAGAAWLTYGRIRAAYLTIFLYGFLSQAAMGVALWLMARLSRTMLAAPGIAVIGTKIWNFGVML